VKGPKGSIGRSGALGKQGPTGPKVSLQRLNFCQLLFRNFEIIACFSTQIIIQ